MFIFFIGKVIQASSWSDHYHSLDEESKTENILKPFTKMIIPLTKIVFWGVLEHQKATLVTSLEDQKKHLSLASYYLKDLKIHAVLETAKDISALVYHSDKYPTWNAFFLYSLIDISCKSLGRGVMFYTQNPIMGLLAQGISKKIIKDYVKGQFIFEEIPIWKKSTRETLKLYGLILARKKIAHSFIKICCYLTKRSLYAGKQNPHVSQALSTWIGYFLTTPVEDYVGEKGYSFINTLLF